MIQNNTSVEIKNALSGVSTLEFTTAVRKILSILGYESERSLDLTGCPSEFIREFPGEKQNTNSEQEFLNHVKSVKLVFQYTDEEMPFKQRELHFNRNSFEKSNKKSNERSFLFFAVELKEDTYPRGKYAKFTREINKRISVAPTVVFFKNSAKKLTLSLVHRRKHKGDRKLKVLGDVSLLREIDPINPHRAHMDILEELSFSQLLSWINKYNKPKNFDGLFQAWLGKLNIEELNKRFYDELLRWYQTAVSHSSFPDGNDENEQIIRLITRILFIWFIKEKELVEEELFNESHVTQYLKNYDAQEGDSYYRVVLQNLFFATLNTEVDQRGFSDKGQTKSSPTKYIYKSEMRLPDELLELFSRTPFINGGLFDCLGKNEDSEIGGGFIDCFSDRESIHKLISIPNRLFFDNECGLFPLLRRYKFTVEENTPIEQEVALDPELLGRVFEGLLAFISTGRNQSLRKKTGSFYTPRQIVEFIVDKSLLETLKNKCKPSDGNMVRLSHRLGCLLDHSHDDDHAQGLFSKEEKKQLVQAISELKILDPTVGSGAFPVSLLLKLTLILRRLDSDNKIWRKIQENRVKRMLELAHDSIDDSANPELLLDINSTFQKYNDSDFGRKLYLIQNSIFGVDIQPIACQIAKLRFFVSLIIEQNRIDDKARNFGIKPLPNLDMHFLSADSLLSLKLYKKGVQREIFDKDVYEKQKKINLNREQYFHATNQTKKLSLAENDKKLRQELVDILRKDYGLSEEYKNEVFKIAKWDPFDQSSKADWFDMKYMFGIDHGFDIVFGNPPYIQLQNNGGELAHRYRSEKYESFASTGDIYCLFIEFGLKLLKNSGHLCFITSNKWMRANYGAKLIELLAKFEWNKKLLIDFNGIKVFASATVDTSILLISKEESTQQFVAAKMTEEFKEQTDIGEFVLKHGITMKKFDYIRSGPIFIGTDAENELKEKIENIGTPLKEWDISIYRGVITGKNDAFIIDNSTKEELIRRDSRSAEILKPILKGRHIRRYLTDWKQTKNWLIATIPALGIDIDEYQAIKQHLLSFGKERLEQSGRTLPNGTKSRKKTIHSWYELQDTCAYHAEFEKQKIVWPDISTQPNFSHANAGVLISNTAYMITGMRQYYLLGILNSNITRFFIPKIATSLGEKGNRYIKRYFVEKIPIPKIQASDEFVNTIDQLLEVKKFET